MNFSATSMEIAMGFCHPAGPRVYRKLKCPACGHEYQSRAEKKARCVECSHEFYPAMNRVMG